jgi:hypothetical protein
MTPESSHVKLGGHSIYQASEITSNRKKRRTKLPSDAAILARTGPSLDEPEAVNGPTSVSESALNKKTRKPGP